MRNKKKTKKKKMSSSSSRQSENDVDRKRYIEETISILNKMNKKRTSTKIDECERDQLWLFKPFAIEMMREGREILRKNRGIRYFVLQLNSLEENEGTYTGTFIENLSFHIFRVVQSEMKNGHYDVDKRKLKKFVDQALLTSNYKQLNAVGFRNYVGCVSTTDNQHFIPSSVIKKISNLFNHPNKKDSDNGPYIDKISSLSTKMIEILLILVEHNKNVQRSSSTTQEEPSSESSSKLIFKWNVQLMERYPEIFKKTLKSYNSKK